MAKLVCTEQLKRASKRPDRRKYEKKKMRLWTGLSFAVEKKSKWRKEKDNLKDMSMITQIKSSVSKCSMMKEYICAQHVISRSVTKCDTQFSSLNFCTYYICAKKPFKC